jgi:hypothetical protein
MTSIPLPGTDNQDGKMNQILKSNKQEKENSISRDRPTGSINNNSDITRKKINKSFSPSDNKIKQPRNFTKDRKLNLKDVKIKAPSKKEKSKPKKSLPSNKNDGNRSNILNKDIVKIKIQKPSKKMNINKETSVDRRGTGRGTGGATKIPSSHPSQSKQFQSTMDSFNKRVNKGKRK